MPSTAVMRHLSTKRQVNGDRCSPNILSVRHEAVYGKGNSYYFKTYGAEERQERGTDVAFRTLADWEAHGLHVCELTSIQAHLISFFSCPAAQHRRTLLLSSISALAILFVQRTAPYRKRFLEAKEGRGDFAQLRRPLGRRKETGSCGRDEHHFGFMHVRTAALEDEAGESWSSGKNNSELFTLVFRKHHLGP